MVKVSAALIVLAAVQLAPAILNISLGSQESGNLTPQRAIAENFMEVFFIPFEARTYLAITMQNLEEQSNCKFRFVFESTFTSPEYEFSRTVRRMLTATKATEKISKTSIRLKVKYPDAVLFADRIGRILSEKTGENYQLTKEQMAEIQKDILHFCRRG